MARVFGKTGKAETATDSAPLEMVETTIQLKPQDQWRPGMTMDKIIEELDNTVRLPGLANLWVPPIRNRIDMLSTGIKSPIGIKVSGTVLADIDTMAEQIEEVARTVPAWLLRLLSVWKVGVISTLRLTVKSRALRYDGGGCAVVCDFCGGRGDGWRNGGRDCSLSN